jgi:hypothetical protein
LRRFVGSKIVEGSRWEDMVRAVRIEEVEWTAMENSHRNGGLEFKTILTGVEGAPENYWLTLAKGDGHFFSPRHRHNFDQIRMCMAGRTSIDPKKFMEPGEIGYFPEGTPYGPQQDKDENITLVLQFGAASRSGFLSRRQLRQSVAELQGMGEFKAGVFHRMKDAGRKNQDGFEAVWEHAMGPLSRKRDQSGLRFVGYRHRRFRGISPTNKRRDDGR